MLIVLRRRNIEANLIRSGLRLGCTGATPRDRPLSSVAASDLDDLSQVLRFAHVAHATGFYAEAIDGDRDKIVRLARDLGVDLDWLPDVASRDIGALDTDVA